MKIAVFVKGTIFHAQYGGLETQNQTLCEALTAKGYTIHIFTPKKELVETTKTYNNIVYHFVDSKFKMGLFLGFFGSLDKNNWVNRSYEEFIQIHTLEPFNAVISQSTAGLGVIKKREKHNLKSIMVAHGSIVSEYKTFLKEMHWFQAKQVVLFVKNTTFAVKNFFTRQRECVLNSTKVVAVSEFVKNALIEETFAPKEKFIVIHNGIESPKIDTNIKKDQNTLLFVGRLEKSKGVDILLNALKIVLDTVSDTKLIIAGKGPEEEHLKELANQLQIAHNVEFTGWVQQNELPSLYTRASIFVLPTIRLEGFPMTLVEASSYGLALVASDIGGNSDAISDQNGVLLEPGNITDLSHALIKLLSNPTLSTQMGNASKKSFEQNFTRDIMVQRYISVLNNL